MTLPAASIPVLSLSTFLAVVPSPVMQAPAAAEREAAAKSPQAAVVLANQKAIAEHDLDAYRKTLPAAVAASFDGPSGQLLWNLLTKATPTTDLEFLKVSVDGSTATLLMRGRREGARQRGTVTLTLEGGEWKVGPADWEPEP